MRFLRLAILFVILGQPLLMPMAANAADKTLNQTMSQIGGIMARNYPLLMFPRTMKDQEITQMHEDIRRLQVLFSQVGPYIQSKSDAYQLTLGVVKDNLDQALQAMEERHYGLARNRLRITGSLCSSCHTQDNKLRTLFHGSARDAFEDDLSYAEFNFSTRNYFEAEKYYGKYLRSGEVRYDSDILQPLRRLVTIYTQVFNSPNEGAKHLRSYLDLKAHSAESRRFLEDVITAMSELTEVVHEDLSNLDFVRLEQMVMDSLGGYATASPIMFSSPRQEVHRVWLRGLMYRYLNQKANREEIPAILYWLSLVDRALGYNSEFSISDYYLKACIRRYPKSPFARLCYRSYDSYLRYFYTSPIDPVLPLEVDQELAALRRILKIRK